MIETHVHFNNETLEKDLTGVLNRATQVGVTDFIVVGFDAASSAKAVALTVGQPRLWAVVGVHPHDAQHYDAATAEQLRAWAQNPRVVAVGEIGLDFYRDLSPREDQESFEVRGTLEPKRSFKHLDRRGMFPAPDQQARQTKDNLRIVRGIAMRPVEIAQRIVDVAGSHCPARRRQDQLKSAILFRAGQIT